MIIAVLNSKGGVGKSTIATNLARGVQLSGSSVLLVDTDRQGTTRDWGELQADDTGMPSVVALDRPNLGRAVIELDQSYDFVMIDGAAKLEKMVASAVKVSDLILIPVQPSPPDVWAVAELVDLIHARREVTDGKPNAAFVISRQISGSNLASDVQEALVEYGIPVLEARTSQRVAYSEAFIGGSTVLDYEPSGKAAQEIQSLTAEVLSLCIYYGESTTTD